MHGKIIKPVTTPGDYEQSERWQRHGASGPSVEIVENSLPGEEAAGLARHRAYLSHTHSPYTTHSPEEFKEDA